jgi:lysophospholipase L1-like esterase
MVARRSAFRVTGSGSLRGGGYGGDPEGAPVRRLVAIAVTAALAAAGLVVLGAPAATAATAPNLLSANQASVESGLAGFAAGTGREKLARTRYTGAAHGRAVLAMTSTSTKVMAARTVMAGQIAAVGAVYAGGMLVKPSSNVRSPVAARAAIVFTASNGKILATAFGPWVSTRSTRWVRLGVAGAKAPARTVSVSLYAEVYTRAKGLTYYADEWGLWRASRLPTWSMPPTTDRTTPTAPAVRGSSNAASTTVAFSFASTDNVGVAGYRVWFAAGAGVSVSSRIPTATLTTGSYVRTSLAPGIYSAIVSAFDRAGNQAFASRVVVTLGAPPSTANLLVPSEASFETGIAGINQSTDNTGAVISLTRSTAQAAAGSSALRIAATTSGTVTVRTERGWTPAVGGQDYDGSALVLPTSSGQQAQVLLNFYRSDLSSNGSSPGTVASLPTGTWTRLQAGGRAPAGTAYVAVVLSLLGTSGSGPVAGDVFYSDAWGVWQSTTLPAWGMPTVPQGVVAAFIGDSYGLGVGVSPGGTTRDRFTTRIADTMGWRELNVARGATGFTNSTTVGCGLPYCGPYSDQVSLLLNSSPDVVFVTGGRNDGAAMGNNPASEKTAVETVIATLHRGLPAARIIVVSPFWDDGLQSDGLQLVAVPTWIKTIAGWESGYVAALATPKVTYVPGAFDWLWLRPDLMNAPTTMLAHHPNAAGYHCLADNIVATLPDRPR